MFGTMSCSYKLMATPNSTEGDIKSAVVNSNNRKVEFYNLSPALQYDFRLETSCGGTKPIITSLGVRKTGPGSKSRLNLTDYLFYSTRKGEKFSAVVGRTNCCQIGLGSTRKPTRGVA